MQHHFDTELAERFGILEAVILENMRFWLAKNAANGKNVHDGRVWTYNSIKAWHDLIPYASEKQIRRALEHLESEGIILTGNYNQSAYDRTKWYAFTDEGNAICPYGQIEETARANQNAHMGEPIPDSKPIGKPLKNTKKGQEAIVDDFTDNSELRAAIMDFIEMRKAMKSKMTDRALTLLLGKLQTMGRDDSERVALLNQSIVNGWKSIYPLKDQPKRECNGLGWGDLEKYAIG